MNAENQPLFCIYTHINISIYEYKLLIEVEFKFLRKSQEIFIDYHRSKMISFNYLSIYTRRVIFTISSNILNLNC